MFPLPPDSAVALAYPAHESSGDTLLAWIHVPRTDLPKRHAVVLRWRRGARYLGWARGRVVVEAGPDRATWQVAAVPIPPTTGAVTLELWGDGPGARLLAAGAVELRPADAPVAAPEMLLAPALLPEGATVGGLRRAALRHPDPLPRFERIAAEPGATVALDGRRAHVPAGLPHGIGWIRTDATAGDDSGPIPLRLVAAE